jgi:gamma-glutamyltranspeptidase/glutathione hydrolase
LFKNPFPSSKAVIATENYVSSLVGYKTLALGGNAIDAAVTTSIALSLNIPHLGGLGGDFLALIYIADKNKVYCINGSGYAPKKLSIEHLHNAGYQNMPEKGPLSITIPGLLDGIYQMWKKFGTTDWSKLIKEVYSLYGKGFSACNSLINAYRKYKVDLLRDAGSRTTYKKLDDAAYGTPIRFEGLYKTLELISEDHRIFYEGEIAESIQHYVTDSGGVIEYEDLKKYKAEWVEPLTIEFNGNLIYEMPPNTQGVTTLQILKLFEETNLSELSPNSINRIKTSIDLFKIAYYIRDQYITDPKYMHHTIDELLSSEFLKSIHMENAEPYTKRDGDTTYFTIIDNEGNIISGIQSLFHPFGSLITEPTYGITLNSRASSFSLNKKHINCLYPGKKPLHTLSSIIANSTSYTLALGLSGGHYRPQLHSEILTNILIYNMNVQEALEYPRYIWIPNTNKIEFENGYEECGIYKYITVKRKYPSRMGVAAASILRDDNIRISYCDIRGEGIPLGLV